METIDPEKYTCQRNKVRAMAGKVKSKAILELCERKNENQNWSFRSNHSVRWK